MNIPYSDPRIAGDFLMTAGAYGPYSEGTKEVLDYIECSATTRIDILEELVNGVSTDVIAEHNITPSATPGLGYVIKSKYGHGFSHIVIAGAGYIKAFVLNSQIESNNQDSVESGINFIG